MSAFLVDVSSKALLIVRVITCVDFQNHRDKKVIKKFHLISTFLPDLMSSCKCYFNNVLFSLAQRMSTGFISSLLVNLFAFFYGNSSSKNDRKLEFKHLNYKAVI